MSHAPFLSRAFRAHPLESAALAFLCAGTLAWGLAAEPAQLFAGLLTASLFGVTAALGAAVFLAMQGVSGARWWMPLRGTAAALATSFVVPAAVLAAVLAPALAALTPQAAHAASPWLARPMVLARAAVVLLAWAGLIALLVERTAALGGAQDARRRFARASVAFFLVLAPTLSVASWDWLMALLPGWTSTMFSVYLFAGTFLSGIAAVAALALLLDAGGRLPEPLSAAVRQDLGKLLFAFSMFWAYIWFCQYLLIWYSNLPEETPYYALRSRAGWSALFWLTPVLSFGVPFAALLSGAAKRRPAVLAQVAVVVLVGRWLDLYVMVAPSAGPVPSFPFHGAAATLLLLGGLAFAFDRAYAPRQARAEDEDEAEARPRAAA